MDDTAAATDPDIPAGLTVRPLRPGGADTRLAFEVVSLSERGRAVADPTSVDRMRHLLAGPDTDPTASRLVLDEATPVALLVVCPVRGRTVFLEVHVRPGADPRLHRLLIDEGLAAARRHAARDPAPRGPAAGDPFAPDPGRWQAAAAPDGSDADYQEALTAVGFRQALRFWKMRLALSEGGREPVAPPPPPGVTLTVARSERDLRAVHEVYTESFLDHAASVPRPFQEWRDVMTNLPGYDPSGVWLAGVDGRAVGFCIVDDSRADVGDGHVRAVGVLRHARRRGIGRWLVNCAVVDAVRRGRGGLALTVDSRSPTGAMRLYESLGMSVVQVVEDWRRPLP